MKKKCSGEHETRSQGQGMAGLWTDKTCTGLASVVPRPLKADMQTTVQDMTPPLVICQY